jgi:hypothetical protein
MIKKFVPYSEIKSPNTLIIDGKHPIGLPLSHWKGQNEFPEIADDTSAGIVLNAIEKKKEFLNFPFISATHFDVDGFIGVWSLYYPELALKHKDVLKEIALIGDFRIIADINSEISLNALKLVCWINALEEKYFYKPFGYVSKKMNEMEECVAKFDFFLPRFAAVLLNPEASKTVWQKEYEKVLSDFEEFNSNNNIEIYPEIDLGIVYHPKPLHYYALFSAAKDCDIVVSVYDGNKYEIEYKYTTWVDIVSRKTFPRIDMSRLVKKLNKIEKNSLKWTCNRITDTGPILRLEKNKLNKEERFSHPFEREIYASSINSSDFKEIVLDYFNTHLKNVERKYFWKFEEMK